MIEETIVNFGGWSIFFDQDLGDYNRSETRTLASGLKCNYEVTKLSKYTSRNNDVSNFGL